MQFWQQSVVEAQVQGTLWKTHGFFVTFKHPQVLDILIGDVRCLKIHDDSLFKEYNHATHDAFHRHM